MEKKQYRRKCFGQSNKERTQGALLRRSVFSYYSPNGRIYDRIVAVVRYLRSYYVFTTIELESIYLIEAKWGKLRHMRDFHYECTK